MSFGEEIILGFEELYQYTVVATTAMELYRIPEHQFREQFGNLADVTMQMKEAFLSNRMPPDDYNLFGKDAKESILHQSAVGFPEGYANEVLQSMRNMGQDMDYLKHNV